jgi:D-serine dehydratase
MTALIPTPRFPPLDACDKGVPGHAQDIALQDVAAQGWNLLREDLTFPVAVLKQAELIHNSRWMKNFLLASGVSFAPHGKTTMSPELFDLQLGDGAWAVTVATPHQLQVARKFGYKRIFLANQLVGRSAIEYVTAELEADPAFEFYCLVDSLEGIEQLTRNARRAGQRRISVLVEMGYAGGRTGCRSVAEGLKVARAVAAESDALALCGIEGFEGLLRADTPADAAAAVEKFLDSVTALAKACDTESLFSSSPVLLSAGGSTYFDLVVKKLSLTTLSRATRVVLRSGCYLTQDSLMYSLAFANMRERSQLVAGLGEGLRPAIEVWAYVQSRPEDTLVIAALGKRDISYDELPVAVSWFRPGSGAQHPSPLPAGHRVTRLNDQHCHMSVPADSPLGVGDLMAFGVSHPCLTFDKWRIIHRIDEHYNVIGSLRTYF